MRSDETDERLTATSDAGAGTGTARVAAEAAAAAAGRWPTCRRPTTPPSG